MVVVPDASLKARRAAGRLDPANQAGLRQRMQGLIDSLQGDLADAIAHPRGDCLYTEMTASPNRREKSDTGRSHPQAGAAQLFGGRRRG